MAYVASPNDDVEEWQMHEAWFGGEEFEVLDAGIWARCGWVALTKGLLGSSMATCYWI